MELIPESNQKEIITKGNAVLSSSKNSKINGFKSFFKEYISFSHSCQYYLSPHFDIYIYQLENKEAIQVFLQSASCKWLLFYLDTGNIQLINLNDKSRKLFSSQTESDLIAQKIHSIKNLIDCYPFKRHTLYGLSTKFNLGIRIIKLHFKQLFNKSVFQYCIEKRIEYAIYLLENHLDYSIKKVALICGFRKTQHFIRQFQQKFGLSPGQYRNKILIKRKN